VLGGVLLPGLVVDVDVVFRTCTLLSCLRHFLTELSSCRERLCKLDGVNDFGTGLLLVVIDIVVDLHIECWLLKFDSWLLGSRVDHNHLLAVLRLITRYTGRSLLFLQHLQLSLLLPFLVHLFGLTPLFLLRHMNICWLLPLYNFVKHFVVRVRLEHVLIFTQVLQSQFQITLQLLRGLVLLLKVLLRVLY